MVKNLKSLRTAKGLSQQKLGEILGISQQSVNKYENHKIEPDISTLITLADFFNTSVDYLIGNTQVNHIIEHIEPHDLNKDETEILCQYRKLSPSEKESIKLIISNYLKSR